MISKHSAINVSEVNYSNTSSSNVSNDVSQATNIINFNDNKQDDLKKIFSPIFEKYNIEYNIDLLFNIIGDIQTDSLEDIQTIKRMKKCLDIVLKECYNAKTASLNVDSAKKLYKEYYISGGKIESKSDNPNSIESLINTQYAKANNGEKVDLNSLSTEEKKAYIKDYFKSLMNEYMSKTNMTNEKAEQLLLADFGKLVLHTSDEEKGLLLESAVEVFQKPDAVKLLFGSYNDADKALELANSVSLSYLKGKNVKGTEIVKHMSEEKIIKYLQETDDDFNKFYQTNKEIVDRVINKVQSGEELSDVEQGIKVKLDSYEELRNILITGTRENVFISQEDKQKIEFKIKEFDEQLPSNIKNYRQYYEEKKSMEASATDEKTGGFKTPEGSELSLAERQEKVAELKEQVTNIMPEEGNVTVDTNKKPDETSDEKFDFKTLVAIFSGKEENIKPSDKYKALSQFDRQDVKSQLLLVLNATQERLNECYKYIKFPVLKMMVELGCYASNSGSTKFLTELYEEKVQENKAS